MWEEKLPVRKYNTIIFVPHAKARFRKLTISSRALALTALSVVTVLVAAIAFGWAFLSGARRDYLYRQALAENARLKSSTRELSHKLEGLSRQFSIFESRTRQLAIVAGLSDAASKAQGGPNLPTDPSGRTGELDARLNQIETQFRRHSDIASSTPTVAPVRGLLNSGFGSRMDPFTGEGAFHPGVDISTRRHEPVLATAEGVVARSGWAGDYGKAVQIAHTTGYTTIYGHLDVILVKDGQHVHRGEQVGLVGSTGRATGPHLHYEVRKNDRLLNPLEYILDSR
jgi:murein DD-endopeptidase MepM/ murein hydrolase activator NlpD